MTRPRRWRPRCRRFEEKFGRPPGPDDPLFFDPDADEPQPVSLTGLETATVAMLEAAGICPAWIYAYQHTGGLLPRPDGSFATGRDQAEWDEVISRYVRVHQPGAAVDHQAETRKLQNIMTIMTLQMAADDPGYGAATGRAAGGSPAGRRARTQPCCASTCAPAPASWAARCAPTARSSWRRVSMPGPGVAPAWPAACKPQRAPGQATASPTMSCSPPQSR